MYFATCIGCLAPGILDHIACGHIVHAECSRDSKCLACILMSRFNRWHAPQKETAGSILWFVSYAVVHAPMSVRLALELYPACRAMWQRIMHCPREEFFDILSASNAAMCLFVVEIYTLLPHDACDNYFEKLVSEPVDFEFAKLILAATRLRIANIEQQDMQSNINNIL